jgi:acyl-coenzyme A thioesterase PaaI-like protein
MYKAIFETSDPNTIGEIVAAVNQRRLEIGRYGVTLDYKLDVVSPMQEGEIVARGEEARGGGMVETVHIHVSGIEDIAAATRAAEALGAALGRLPQVRAGAAGE